MNNQQKKEYLSQYRVLVGQVEDIRCQLLELRELAVRTSPLLTTGRTGGGPNIHRLERAVEQLEDARERLAQKLEQAMAWRKDIEQLLDSVQDERHRRLLVHRYLLGQTWQQAAESLCMDERWLRRLHEKALAQLEIPEHFIAS